MRPRSCDFRLFVSACCMFVGAVSTPSYASAEDNAVPRNVIVMISDGCGFNHVLAASLYQDGEPEQQRYQKTFTPLAMSTYPAGGKYDPEQVYSSLDACKEGATDSAAAATAMASGVKTRKGSIGVDPDGTPVRNVVEAAEDMGKATGVITTVPLSHATPAGFVAHVDSRGSYEDIAQEMFGESAVDVVMGAGHPLFDDDGKHSDKDTDAQYKYVGGKATWRALTEGKAMSDADGDGTPDPWTLVQSREEMLALVEAPPKRVAGVLPVNSTAQVKRAGVDANPKDDAPYETPRLTSVPSLAEMSQAALAVLGQDPDGFFLMIEAARRGGLGQPRECARAHDRGGD